MYIFFVLCFRYQCGFTVKIASAELLFDLWPWDSEPGLQRLGYC
jgi:hypothetical protein